MVCEKCWGDAYLRTMEDTSKTQSEHYLDLLAERDGKACGSRWEYLEETSPSGKNLYRCVICGRISATPDKECKTLADPDNRCAELEKGVHG